jgi:DNA-damage-inducible protein J
MKGDTVVRARIDEKTKREASAVPSDMGLTVSDALRLILARVAADKALPFETFVPNAETFEAMEAARRGETVKIGSNGFLASLDQRGELR